MTERRNWTSLEDSLLSQATAECQTQLGRADWALIAVHVPGRDRKACRKRWHQGIGVRINKGHWTPEEDHRLEQAYSVHGAKWARIAEVVQTRNGDQCLKRWRDALDPQTDDQRPWTESEDARLMEAVREHGTNWAGIAAEKFPDRSGLAVRRRERALRLREEERERREGRMAPTLFINAAAR